MLQTVPTPIEEHIETLDVLRGFALLGIMSINVFIFMHPVNWFDIHWDSIGPLEYGFEIFKLVFVQGKFYALFAFLFGVGFTVQLASAERRGDNFAKRFFWRMVILFFIALIHVTFIWDGDILKNYAVAGLMLLCLYVSKPLADMAYKFFTGREKAPRYLIIVAACLSLFGPYAGWGVKVYKEYQIVEKFEAGIELAKQEQQVISQRKDAASAKSVEDRKEKKAEQHDIFANKGYKDVLAYRLGVLKNKLWQPFFSTLVLGLFLFGVYFGRQNLIGRAKQNRDFFVKLTVGCFAVGMVFNTVFVWAMMNMPPHVGSFFSFAINFGKSGAGLFIALSYVGLITLLMLGPVKRYLRWLAPIGRMTLTNYLLQSLVGVSVFYGYGLGWMNDFSVPEQFIYILAMVALQTVFSSWWLSHYRYGPVEWLWRSLAYWQCQPMRLNRKLKQITA